MQKTKSGETGAADPEDDEESGETGAADPEEDEESGETGAADPEDDEESGEKALPTQKMTTKVAKQAPLNRG